MSKELLTPTALSNLFAMAITSQRDERQKVGMLYTIPNIKTRELRARLILEEALETIKAMGLVACVGAEEIEIGNLGVRTHWRTEQETNLEGIIDGCVDTIYVATGCLISCGVPDVPHLLEVIRANDDKFPNGIATMNEETGKYLKPLGWGAPCHETVRVTEQDNYLINLSKKLLEDRVC